MKINNLGYLIKEGFRGIFLHGFMSTLKIGRASCRERV